VTDAARDPDLWTLYAHMLRSRLYEEAVSKLWHDGLVSGEMHLGTGEEAIVAGVVSQLRDGDALALDHRGTSALLVRGVDPVSILREMLGRPDGLCGGMGGHMHLFSRGHLAASSGIVGAAGPTAAGFALAAQHTGGGGVAVGFFGDGAMNQGMLMESLNLAAVWKLPALFVCKDDGWAITTRSEGMSGTDPSARARGLGLPAVEVDGRDVAAVWHAARASIERARTGGGPGFLHARCVHLEGHFLGFQLKKIADGPLKEMSGMAMPLTRSLLGRGGGSLRERTAGLKEVLSAVRSALRDARRDEDNDPIRRARQPLETEPERLKDLEDRIEGEVGEVLETALEEGSA